MLKTRFNIIYTFDIEDLNDLFVATIEKTKSTSRTLFLIISFFGIHSLIIYVMQKEIAFYNNF